MSVKNKDPKGLYATQAELMKEALNAVGASTEVLKDYSTGHAVPQSESHLQQMYDFLLKHVSSATGITTVSAQRKGNKEGAAYDLLGRRIDAGYKGLVVKNGRLCQWGHQEPSLAY